jgi:hypothetical protein
MSYFLVQGVEFGLVVNGRNGSRRGIIICNFTSPVLSMDATVARDRITIPLVEGTEI